MMSQLRFQPLCPETITGLGLKTPTERKKDYTAFYCLPMKSKCAKAGANKLVLIFFL